MRPKSGLKAVEGGDKSPVIIEHYGDVLHQLNHKKEALEYWKKAKYIGAIRSY